MGADGIVLAPVVLGGLYEVQDVVDLLKEEWFVLQGGSEYTIMYWVG